MVFPFYVLDISIFILSVVVVCVANRLQTADRNIQRSFNINLPCGFAKRNTKCHNAAATTTREFFDLVKCKNIKEKENSKNASNEKYRKREK